MLKHLQVLAGLLKMADRADWRNCTYSKEEETKMAGDFKSQFQEFDPNEWFLVEEVLGLIFMTQTLYLQLFTYNFSFSYH